MTRSRNRKRFYKSSTDPNGLLKDILRRGRTTGSVPWKLVEKLFNLCDAGYLPVVWQYYPEEKERP